MKKFIYIKERGFISYQNETATQSFQIAGTGIKNSGRDGVAPQGFSHDFASGANDAANTTVARNRLRVVVTSAAANTGNRGSDYTEVQTANGVTAASAADTVAGGVTVLKESSFTMVANNLIIANVSGNSQKGYDIKDGDLVEITDCFVHTSGEMMVRADRLIGLAKLSTTTTHLRFQAIRDAEGNNPDSDDIIQFIYGAGEGMKTHKKICEYFESWINSSNTTDDGLLLLDFNPGGYWPKELKDVFQLNVTKQG